MLRKKGRPKKDVDVGIVFHMLKNNAPITIVARHLGIHRDTLYVNFAQVIKEAREAHLKAWREVIRPKIEECDKQRRLKLEAKLVAQLSKRKYKRRIYPY